MTQVTQVTQVQAPPKVGRPKGSGGKHVMTIMGKINTDALERIREQCTDGMLTPLDVLFAAMNDPDIDTKTRVMAASIALPYFHSKMPTAVEISGPEGGPIDISDSRARISHILFGTTVDIIDAEIKEQHEQE